VPETIDFRLNANETGFPDGIDGNGQDALSVAIVSIEAWVRGQIGLKDLIRMMALLIRL
jgi:ABC-type uncharacterized transport system ATPase subunit